MTTQLPFKQIAVLCVVVFAEPVSLTILYPFIYFMVRDFHISSDDRDIGFYAGLIAASFSLAQFITSVPWGYISNRIGRRPVILIGLLGNLITSILFGMSKNLVWALCSRGACGLLNGNIAVAKCVLGEITDGTNQAKAFSLFGFMFGLGCMVAPTIGGLLADPARKYPNSFLASIELFVEYPYLLPCLFSCVVSLVGLVAGFMYLEETLNRNTLKAHDEGMEMIPEETRINYEQNETNSLLSRQSSVSSYSTIFQDTNDDDEIAIQIDGLGSRLHEEDSTRFFSASMTIIAYTFLAFVQIVFQEIYVFWCNASVADGGLGWSSTDVGISLAFGGVFILLIQLVIFPIIQKRMGNLKLFQYSMLFQAPLMFIAPFIHDLLSEGQWAVWLATIGHHFLRSICQTGAFTTVMVMINNSADSSSLGLVNGIAQSMASLVRGIGPALGGWLWRMSLKGGLSFPFDYHFVFTLLSILTLIAWLQSFFIPRSVA